MPPSAARVFLSDVDTPIPHVLARRLAKLVVGSRRPPDEDAGDNDNDDGSAARDDDNDGDHGALGRAPSPRRAAGGGTGEPDTYQVIGATRFDAADEDMVPADLLTDGADPVGKSVETRDLMDAIATRGRAPALVKRAFPARNRDELQRAILEANVVIIDFLHSIEDVPFILQVLNDNAHQFINSPKTVIALSTVLTWARTKPDLDDPDAPIAEDEYRRRKPHSNFRVHVQMEKEWVKLAKKECYRAYVVWAGLVYHAGESVLHPMLKAAWHGEHVAVYGDGANAWPMIHVDDLCEVVVNLVEKRPAGFKYMLAIEDARPTYADVARAISQTLGTGKVRAFPTDHLLVARDLSATTRDLLLANLKLEAAHIKSLGMQWRYETGLIENLPRFLDEFRRARGLTPLRMILLGPPMAGKSYYAAKLASYYKLPLVDVEGVTKETMDRLHRRVALGVAQQEREQLVNDNGGETAADPVDPNVEQIDPADWEAEKELLDELTEFAKINNGAVPVVHLHSFLRAKLASMACQNQGYVLDAFPTTRSEALALFRKDDAENGTLPASATGANGDGNDDDVENGGARAVLDPTLAPDQVLVLDAPDDWLRDRAMQRAEADMTARTNEDGFNARLAAYRAQNADNVTVLNVFDEAEIHPAFFNVATGAAGPGGAAWAARAAQMHEDGAAAAAAAAAGSASADGAATGEAGPAPAVAAVSPPPPAVIVSATPSGPSSTAPIPVGSAKPVDVMDAMVRLLGKPHNYGPSREDVALRKRLQAEEATQTAARMQREEERRHGEEQDRHAKAVADWNAKLAEVKRQEQQVLEAQSLPLRHYLMRHVMPVLTSGLMEVCKVRPEDPVDYLAEFLFRHAPPVPAMDAPAAATGPLPPPVVRAKSPPNATAPFPPSTGSPRGSGSRPGSGRASASGSRSVLPPIKPGSARGGEAENGAAAV
ncbi:Adenylate kinase 7 [Allomyces javanicus]|nr:Adenylate kinase 7 [Allomyces javanicus]